mmetsp:Transcript_58013/g.173144  ORF Transcript_58013/g.173144 Transcript_58013/m.173144 type:complete len:232 (-) Transcript_58013:1106-1801(-)
MLFGRVPFNLLPFSARAASSLMRKMLGGIVPVRPMSQRARTFSLDAAPPAISSGIVPDMSLPLPPRRKSIPLKYLALGGMLPDIMLSYSTNTLRFSESSSKSIGSCPVRKLMDRSNTSSAFNLFIVAGIDPVNSFSHKRKYLRFSSSPTQEGIVEVSAFRLREISLTELPRLQKDSGILPPMSFPCKSNRLLSIVNISSAIVPVKLLFTVWDETSEENRPRPQFCSFSITS